jgi:hypothetical protein
LVPVPVRKTAAEQTTHMLPAERVLGLSLLIAGEITDE